MTEISMEVRSWLRKRLEEADPDLLREMVSSFVHMLMSAEADTLCGASYGERSEARINRRNGYREREFDTRVGTMPLAIPKLRAGSYFPGWLLEPRRRAERALVAVITECYVAGVYTRRVDSPVRRRLGATGSRSPGCPRWRRAWMRGLKRSATGRWTADPTVTCGLTP